MESSSAAIQARSFQRASTSKICSAQLFAHEAFGRHGTLAARIRRVGAEGGSAAARRHANAPRRIEAVLTRD
jgi:hypothetical protein